MLKNNSEPLNWRLIGWIGAGLVIFGYYLNANEYIASWLIWIVGNIMVGIYSIYKKAYSTAGHAWIVFGLKDPLQKIFVLPTRNLSSIKYSANSHIVFLVISYPLISDKGTAHLTAQAMHWIGWIVWWWFQRIYWNRFPHKLQVSLNWKHASTRRTFSLYQEQAHTFLHIGS